MITVPQFDFIFNIPSMKFNTYADLYWFVVIELTFWFFLFFQFYIHVSMCVYKHTHISCTIYSICIFVFNIFGELGGTLPSKVKTTLPLK